VANISKAFKEYENLTNDVAEALKKKHKKKSLNKEQQEVAEALAKAIFMNEEKTNWNSSIKAYLAGNTKSNPERINELSKIVEEHSIDLFSAAILNYSQTYLEKV